MAGNWLKDEARTRQAEHDAAMLKTEGALERCRAFADHFYKFFDLVVVAVVADIKIYNGELKVEGYKLSYKREGYSFIAHFSGDPSCRIDISGDTER